MAMMRMLQEVIVREGKCILYWTSGSSSKDFNKVYTVLARQICCLIVHMFYQVELHKWWFGQPRPNKLLSFVSMIKGHTEDLARTSRRYQLCKCAVYGSTLQMYMSKYGSNEHSADVHVQIWFQ